MIGAVPSEAEAGPTKTNFAPLMDKAKLLIGASAFDPFWMLAFEQMNVWLLSSAATAPLAFAN